MKFLFFWGHQPPKDGSLSTACFSQWWRAPFTVEGVQYPTAEHWMMANKAVLFGDEPVAQQIRQSGSPRQAKALGRTVSGFDEQTWDANKYGLVLKGTLHKFRAHPPLLDFLLGTKKKVLVEASPADRVWGIGLSEDNPHASNPLKWRGQNLLGFALMEAREILAKR